MENTKIFNLKNLESFNRITSIPIVESGWFYAENIYNKVKESNNLLYWTLDRAESSFQNAVDIAMPAIGLFEIPISSMDKILCKTLDVVEKTVPSINRPPEVIVFNTKQYVSEVGNKIVRPILKRADSVKNLGASVLSSKYTAYAADTLDGALNVADKYVDKYLPASIYDDQNSDEVNDPISNDTGDKAMNTIHHVGRFSGKLQRRLTKRTLAEAKALKKQSTEAIHVLIYVAELITTDPKLALEKGKELWESLSQDEPENQARPETLEQLIVLLTRESARRIVHIINFSSRMLKKIPTNISHTILVACNKSISTADAILDTIHLKGVPNGIKKFLNYQINNSTVFLKQLSNLVIYLAEQMAKSATAIETHQKQALEVPKIKVQLRASHRNKNSNNGVDNAQF